MKKTTNYGLALYDKEDKFNITAEEDSLNASMIKIDNVLKEKATINDMTNYIEEHKEELKGADGKDGINGTDGKDGVNGKDGENGLDGYSPTAKVETTPIGATITIIDKNGTTITTISNGKDGVDGSKGDKGEKGETGATGKDGVSVTHSWTGTTLTVTSASGTSSTDLKGEQGIQGIQGEKGEKGDKGETGSKGDKGDKGDTGLQGPKGDKGDTGSDYVLTDTDKNEIANKTKELIPLSEYVKSVNNTLPDETGNVTVTVTAEQPEFVVKDTLEEGIEWLEENGDTTKKYVLPDGYIYSYIYGEKLISYKNYAEPLPDNTTDTAKWVNGHRISSSGVSAQAGTTTSNIVPCKTGSVIRIKGVTLREGTDRVGVTYIKPDNSEGFGVGYFNNGITFGSSTPVVYNGLEDGVYKFTLSNWGDYVITGFRFAMPTPADASQVIVTVNEEIKEPTIIKEYAWTNTGISFAPSEYDDEFNAINKDITQLEVDVANLEKSVQELENDISNIGTTDVPDYWKSHLEEKIATIRNLHKQYGKDCFSFVLMADTHYPANLGKISPLLAKKIMDEVDIKYVLHAGDWQTRGCHKTKQSLLDENEAIKTMFAPIQDRLLMQQGNHDGSYGLLDRDGDGTYNNIGKEPANRESYVHNLTPQELHEFAYRKVGMIGNVHFDDTGTAYYIDDVSNNVRYIGLNSQCNNYELQTDGTQLYPKMWIMRYTQSQFDFLINEALVENTNDKTKIVIFAHVPTTQELGDGDVMNGVLKAFVNKTTYTGSYDGTYGYDSVSVNVDFRNVKGTLVGYFHGHNHIDSVNTSNGFNIIGTRCDGKEENDSTLNAERVKGTITEQSFDVFTVTSDKIYATKIGAGSDREISY